MKNTSIMAIYKQVERAAKNGGIDKPSCCENCGKKSKLQGHYDDYDKPLSVRWLCAKCHRGLHSNNPTIKPTDSKLTVYIKQHGVRDLAEKIPANPMYLRQIGWGKARPSLTMAKKIIEATDGKVTFDDLIQLI